MTKSSRSRRSRAKARKRIANGFNGISKSNTDNTLAGQTAAKTAARAPSEPALMPKLSRTDKLYMGGFAALSLVVTIFYWSLGGRNLFVFPALFCLSVGARKYWSGPMRKFAGDM